ncbi:hypothetical protein [Saccharothrix sp. ST-888]|uniref:hypothetical protein n=1 Tax=Saccharothrix sp. ST-888 TaxID=1427391 RepID=UPI0005EC9B08|nr:hypothetical protein [Saccharothrix sp. ST-888]KJK57434.1 hypothetical protein UK12_16670 [Saccharothrix sp. ST-888]
MVRLLVDIRPFPGMLLFHRAFTRPLVDIDGVETEARWGGVTQLPVEPGLHDLAVYFRYRFQKKARLATGRAELNADGTMPELPVKARLGPFNHSHFRVTLG